METVDIDVENLFNDDQLDAILPREASLQAATLGVPGLAEQFLNQSFSGGFKRVSWSRQGHVATISEDGLSVNIQCLRSSLKGWELSEARPLGTTFEEGAIHVSWGPSGLDLAVVDKKGRLGIYSMTTICLNRLSESKSPIGDTLDAPGMPVGTWWLNQDRQDRPRPIFSSATREESKWVHSTTKAKALKPLFPRAFCMLNRHGVFSLTFQKFGTRYQRSTVGLPMLPGTICSHAAFAPTTEEKVLLVVHSTAGNLSAYHIQIIWPQETTTESKSAGQPELLVEIIDLCISMWSGMAGSNAGEAPAYKPDGWSLTQLSIVPTSDIETAVRQPPCIWAVYTNVDKTVDANSSAFLLNSLIKRWAVDLLVRDLSTRFNDLGSKTETSTSTGSEEVFAVERLSDIVLPQTVTSMELIDAGQVVSISTSDGRTELWNPATQALVSYEGQVDEVTSLAQFGFAFNPVIGALSTTLSPNACSSISLTAELKPHLQHAQYPVQPTTQAPYLSDPHQSAGVAAIVLAFTRSCWYSTNGDDILACIKANYAPAQYTIIVSEMYRTLFPDMEFVHEKTPGSDSERLGSKPLVNKVLSFQLALFDSVTTSSTLTDSDAGFVALSRLWAWVTINIRNVATTFYIFYREYQTIQQLQQKPNQPSPPPLSPSSLDSICNSVHWALDLFRLIITTILEIGDRQTNPDFFSPPTFASNLGDSEGNGAQGLVALMLNSQWTRSFLITITRVLHAFLKVNAETNDPQIARVAQAIHRYSISKGISIKAIDKLLDSRWYARCGLRDGEVMDHASIAQRQIALCSTGRLGPEFAGTLRNLLDNVINAPDTGLRATGDIERIKFWADGLDLNWLFLGLDSSFVTNVNTVANPDSLARSITASSPSPSRRLYDVHRKSSIVITGNPDQLIRRCVRCGSVSGDVEAIDKSWSKHMLVYLTRCVCDAYWILEPIATEGG